MPVTQANKQAKIYEKRCIDIYLYMRDVCSTKLLQVPIILGSMNLCLFILEGTNQVQYLSVHLSLIFSRMVLAVHQLKNNGYLGWWIHPQDLL